MPQLPSLTLIPEDNIALSDEITRLAGHINAAQHRFLTLLAALIERDAWAGNGIKSPAHWLNYHCGMLVLRGRMTPEDGAVFMKAVEAMVAAQNPPINQDDDSANLPGKTFPQKRVDALLALAEQAMNTIEEGLQPLLSTDKYQVVIHIEGGNQRGHEHSQEQHCSIESGAHHLPLSPATARRLCCDASLVPVLEDASGNVLNIGRKTRAIPPSIRRALQIRDHGCRFPGCCESRFVDAHHVQHWCDGGETRLDNLVLLCRQHHRLLHQEGYEIVKRGEQQFEFLTPAGDAMPTAMAPQFATAAEDFATETLAIEREHEGFGLAIESRTAVTRWQRERMDYDLAVGAMMRGPMLGFSAGR
ncbi:MAG: DUF222 domain-containing protein [Pseudohongiella sp.]|nr:DUF222 domain-containing protein [Pseudohongiella sp.]